MDDDFKHSESSNTEAILIHELFLVFRFLSLVMALLQFISFFFYFRVFLRDGPCMCGARFDDVRSLSEAADAQDEATTAMAKRR